MDQNKLAALIKRYRSGVATPEEVAELERLWHGFSEDTSFETDHSAKELESIESEMLRNIKSEIDRHEHQTATPRMSARFFYKIAATIVVLLSVSVWWYAHSRDMIEVRTGYGERIAITLPDQSCVVLNGNSLLTYAPNWDPQSGREVWIEGEGFFSIKHTEDNQKFVVHAADLDVEVLGTKFNVKARSCASEVLLAEGKVKLETKDAQRVVLKPGELATHHNKQLSTRSVEKRRYTSWVQNKLLFEGTTLREVATLLKETYGLEVEFADADLQEKELSGEISSATADDVLHAIAETLDLVVAKQGRSVAISSKQD